MSNYHIIGTDPALESSVPRYDPQSGLYWEQVWAGTETAVANLILAQNLDRTDCDQRYTVDASQRPLFRLTVLTPDYSDGRSNALNKFELVAKPVEKEVYEHPTALALSQINVRAIKEYVQKKTELDNSSAVPTFSSNAAAILYNQALKNARKWLDHEWTFRYSILTSRRYGVLVSLTNVLKLWTTAQLTNPAISGLIIPAGTLFSLATIPTKADVTETVPLYNGTPGATTSHYFKWTWLKLPPEFSQLPSGKMEIRQEWLLDLWSTTLYAEVT